VEQEQSFQSLVAALGALLVATQYLAQSPQQEVVAVLTMTK
jgi:hypothetical protein